MYKNIFKKFIVLFGLGFILFVFNHVFAEDVLPEQILQILPVSIHLEIISRENSLYDEDILVTTCDSDNDPETPDVITVYCALLQSNFDIKWNWAWAPGVFVDSIGEIAGYTSQDNEGKDVYHYWSWSLNGSYAEVGLNYYDESNKLKTGDKISLNFLDPIVEPVITEPAPEVSTHSSSSGSYVVTPKSFSVSSAISFLSSQQKSDGSFGDYLYTDWVAIAISAENNSNLKSSISNYLKNNSFDSSIVTDNERHAMALMSLGIDPYTGTNVNYIKKITDLFDDIQIGDNSLFNDDIFALIVLSKAGYTSNDEMIKKIISYVISKQSFDGSWRSVDMTSAGIMALKDFNNVDGVSESISKAENYLIESQNEDGGFDNSASTTWAIQALSLNNSFNEEVIDAIEYLTGKQQDDGGIDGDGLNNRVWNTSYAIPAVLKLSWGDILESFDKEETEDNNSQNGNTSSSQDEIKKTEVIVLVTPEETKITSVIEEIKVIPIKIVKKENKKITITEKEITADSIAQAGLNNNLLGASVANFDQIDKGNTFLSGIHKILKKIAFPFIWLWVHLGF